MLYGKRSGNYSIRKYSLWIGQTWSIWIIERTYLETLIRKKTGLLGSSGCRKKCLRCPVQSQQGQVQPSTRYSNSKLAFVNFTSMIVNWKRLMTQSGTTTSNNNVTREWTLSSGHDRTQVRDYRLIGWSTEITKGRSGHSTVCRSMRSYIWRTVNTWKVLWTTATRISRTGLHRSLLSTSRRFKR